MDGLYNCLVFAKLVLPIETFIVASAVALASNMVQLAAWHELDFKL